MACLEEVGKFVRKNFENGLNDAKDLVHKYPLISIVGMVVFGILGMLQVAAFTLSAMVSGTLLLAMSALIGYSIFRDSSGFWESIKASCKEANGVFSGS